MYFLIKILFLVLKGYFWRKILFFSTKRVLYIIGTFKYFLEYFSRVQPSSLLSTTSSFWGKVKKSIKKWTGGGGGGGKKGGGGYFFYCVKAPWRQRRRWRRGGMKKMLKSSLAAVLLSASVKRFFVSRMRDFFKDSFSFWSTALIFELFVGGYITFIEF